VQRFSILVVGLLLAGGSATQTAAPDQLSGPDESDHELCARLCEKQQTCDGMAVDEMAIGNCAGGCFRNLKAHPALVSKLRATRACLSKPCGEVYDNCTQDAGRPPKPEPIEKSPNAVGLTKVQCRAVCTKILQCLGGAPASGKQSIDGCSLGCVHGSAGGEAERYRGVLKCADVPCGKAYTDCLAGRGAD